ncbi:protein PIGBOS1 [Scleropages formosus]|uniref:protein PIGBOS1 n=1 Tax=Scleropages formosus TaxID=113540 RepID=UPI0008791DDB|nr:protein PIGBOS1 [Scleropages formosus]
MFRRRIPFHQIAMATILGVAGGLYIYKPVFETPNTNLNSPRQNKKVDGKEDTDVKNETV